MTRRPAVVWLLALALVLPALAAACAPRAAADDLVGPDAVTMRFASPEYGVHTALWWSVTDGAIPEVELTRAMGFGWVKQKFAWRDIEDQVQGSYNVYRPNRITEEVARNGLKLLVRIDRPPQWALPAGQFVDNGPPADPADFGAFCGWLATTYRGRIHAYQVWNEPNLSREWGGQPPDAVAYTALLRACYTAIKAADPDAIVISAGLAPTGTDSAEAVPDERFLRAMYAAGAAAYFDVLGLNAPGYKAAPETDPAFVADPANDLGGQPFFAFRHVEAMRRIMLENGDGAKQVAILEMGWVTDDPAPAAVAQPLAALHPGYAWYAVDAQTQADYLVRAYEYAYANWQPWIGLMTTIFIADPAWTPEAHEQWWWSIVLPDGTPRPAWRALQAMDKRSAPQR